METAFFGEWLVKVGVIDPKQLDTATECMRQVNRRLDDLAIERGWLTRDQTAQLHRAQLGRDMLWGALASEMNLLRPEQVEELLREQGVRQVRLGEMLVELGYLESEQMSRELDAFHDAERVATLSSVTPGELSGCEITKFVLEHLAELSKRMGNLTLKLGAIEPWTGLHDAQNIATRITVRGDVEVHVGLEVDRGLCEELGAGFMGVGPDELDAHLSADLLREFINVLVGNAKSHVANQGRAVELGVPEHAPLEPPACAMLLRTVQGRGWIAFRYS